MSLGLNKETEINYNPIIKMKESDTTKENTSDQRGGQNVFNIAKIRINKIRKIGFGVIFNGKL